MKHTLALLAALALSGCMQVDREALAQWCSNTVAARMAGTPEARYQAAPAVLACQQDPDNERKFSRWTWRRTEARLDEDALMTYCNKQNADVPAGERLAAASTACFNDAGNRRKFTR